MAKALMGALCFLVLAGCVVAPPPSKRPEVIQGELNRFKQLSGDVATGRYAAKGMTNCTGSEGMAVQMQGEDGYGLSTGIEGYASFDCGPTPFTPGAQQWTGF